MILKWELVGPLNIYRGSRTIASWSQPIHLLEQITLLVRVLTVHSPTLLQHL
jgi:hypothetical protein